MATTQTFEEALEEYIQRTKELLGREVIEGSTLAPAPFDQSGPPFEAAVRLDSSTIRQHALSTGDANPLFIDPEYAKHTKYGCQIAPGTILAPLRHPTAHGASRPQGYPVSPYYSGSAWEFFDVVRVGSKFRSTKEFKEFLEKKGSSGPLLMIIAELNYRDFHDDLIAKCYSTEIMVSNAAMGSTSSVELKRLGENLLTERQVHRYKEEEVEQLTSGIQKGLRRRGADTLYWEDVALGEKIGPMAEPPWSLSFAVASSALRASSNSGDHAFDLAYRRLKQSADEAGKEGVTSGAAVVHPVTRWPWTQRADHDDSLLAAYRSLPAAFDFGYQRVEGGRQLVDNWAGDDGFIRRLYMSMRRPHVYGDSGTFKGEVVKKFKETQHGGKGRGAVHGTVDYFAVGIKIEATNQLNQVYAAGTATVYLPSRESASVRLPIPHAAELPFVSYEKFRNEWF